MSLNPPSDNHIDFRTSFPHMNDEELIHFHACKLINETLALPANRSLTKKAIEDRFQFYIRMLEAHYSTTPKPSEPATFRVLRRTRMSSSSRRWQVVGPTFKSLEAANQAAGKIVRDGSARYATLEEGMRYYEFEQDAKKVVEVLVVKGGSIRRIPLKMTTMMKGFRCSASYGL